MSFKICAIGCGDHSFNHHGPSYRKYAQVHTDVLLAACCDVNEDRARGFQLEFGFKKYYTDMFEMLEKEKPDAVCLVVPVELTAKLASGVLERGFPLILEKPPGRTKEETMGLIEIARRKAVPNRVAFNRRFAPLTRALKKCLDDHFRPEDIQNINCEMFRVARTDSDFSTTAIHAVDAVKFLAASEYSGIRFRYHELPRIGAGVANIFMDCTFASGADAFFTISPVTGVSVERITINLLGNTFFLHSSMYSDYDYPGKLVHLRDNKLIFEATGKGISDGKEAFEALGIYYENASFFDDLREGRMPECDLASALQSVEIEECIRNRALEYRMPRLLVGG